MRIILRVKLRFLQIEAIVNNIIICSLRLIKCSNKKVERLL